MHFIFTIINYDKDNAPCDVATVTVRLRSLMAMKMTVIMIMTRKMINRI